MSTNPLIKLWEFFVKGVFKFQRRGIWRNRGWIRAQACGCPHGIPSEYQELSRVKAWGYPRHPLIFIDYYKVVFVELRFYHFIYYVLCLEGIPSSSSTIIRSSSLNYVFITLYIMCYAWSVFFALSFVLFVFWSYPCWILALFVWERDMLRFFIWILLCFAYILLSILS